MTTGEFIKKLRCGNNVYDKKMSQEELGAALIPPVNRAAVNKWETGMVENIKKTHIQQIAQMFGVPPCELMCFDIQFEPPHTSQTENLIEKIQKEFGNHAVLLLQQFNDLNKEGKQKALEIINDLVEHPKYTNQNK